MVKTVKQFVTNLSLLLATPVLVLVPVASAAAATTTITPGDSGGWSTADTRPGGTVSFVGDDTSPLPGGALQLSTSDSPDAKALYLLAGGQTVASINSLGYQTKQVSGPAEAAASFQFAVDVNGAADGGFTTFVYEPYENGTVTNGTWQSWDVAAGQFWSSRSVSCGGTTFAAGAGGAPFFTLAAIKAACPDATVVYYGLNVGTNNANYVVRADALTYNDTTYDFEALAAPQITSPANNATLTSAQAIKIDWTDVTGATGYEYQAFSDAGYTSPVYTSGTLASSEIPTPNTPEGTYYVRVRAVDATGVTSAWSNGAASPYKITVSNTVVQPPVLTYPSSKDACKKDGYKTFTGVTFKNQGDCVSYVATGGYATLSNKPTF
jgi:hypothetical protein